MRARSLRTRLVLATAALVAVGLVVASTATYAVLRSSLLDRVDAALYNGVTRARGIFGPPEGSDVRPRQGPAVPNITYAARIDRAGRIAAERTFGFVEEGAPPIVPAEVAHEVVAGAPTRLLTTEPRSGSSGYRVLATGLPGGGGLILAISLDETSAALRRLLATQVAVSAVVLAGVAAAALWLVRIGLQPLARIEEVAADIAAGDLSRRVEAAGDDTEVGRLGTALNVMLERIDSAFAERAASEARLRRFLADASHELRTPLTSIRGYAELFRRGAADEPADLAVAMRRIEEESQRMGGLVEEMLLLARLDEGRSLEMDVVDLAQIAEDAVADARAVQPQRPLSSGSDGRPVLVRGDAARLRQVAANLLSNALTHTPPDAAVRTRVSVAEGHAVLEVDDDGPGMQEEQAGRAFDRFFRADPARTRDSGGAGLGLSIARAIVEAHGGSISLDSAPGSGTRVEVSLPLA